VCWSPGWTGDGRLLTQRLAGAGAQSDHDGIGFGPLALLLRSIQAQADPPLRWKHQAPETARLAMLICDPQLSWQDDEFGGTAPFFSLLSVDVRYLATVV